MDKMGREQALIGQPDRKDKTVADSIIKGVCPVLFLISVLACVKTVFISLDIDESYALAAGYRLATGEKLFLDLWEPHQLGSIMLAPSLWLFIKLRGSTEGMVLAARTAGTLLHILTGIFLYRTARKTGEMPRRFSFLLFLLHLNFLPKWVQCPEFELQQYWCVLLTFLCFYRYHKGSGSKKGYPVLCGVLLVGQMLSYPTLILLYPVYMAGILLCAGSVRRKKEGALLFTLGAAAAGFLFLGYLGSYLTPGELAKYIGYIFQDESHTLVSTAVKWEIFGLDFLKMLLPLSVSLAVSFAAGKILSGHGAGKKEFLFLSVSLYIFLLGLMQAIGCLFGNENQFYMQWRFFAVALMGILLYETERTAENKVCFLFGILPGFVTILSVLLMTNMDVNTSMAKMYAATLATVWMLGQAVYGKRKEGGDTGEWAGKKGKNWKEAVLWLGGLSILAGLFVCKLVQIRISGCIEATILAPLQKIEAGPAKGVYMLKDTAVILEDDYRVLTEYLTPEDRLLYIGGENIVYLWTEAEIATPSTQGTNAYHEMFIRYYEEHPEKMPTVIVEDKELGVNPVYYNSPRNHIFFEWMADMGYEEAEESEHLKIYRR